MPSPSVYDHLRPTDSDRPDGVYRVVGTDDETVTLLRVGDASGRRVHTGEVVRVPRTDLDAFEGAENPDGDRSVDAVLAGTVEHAYWSVRAFVRQAVGNPLPAAAALALVVAGAVGDEFVSLPDGTAGGLIVLGSLGLALVGSGRL